VRETRGSFSTPEQQGLAHEIAELLTERGETVAVAEATAGGLISAALLQVPGASRYFAGGGVVYTRLSRTALAGVPEEVMANYRGATPEIMANLAGSIRARLGATWGLAESGTAGPTGRQPGLTHIAVAGPKTRIETFETGSDERAPNMVDFATVALRVFRDVLTGS
jgi:nicotinamide-nucleotide amidase